MAVAVVVLDLAEVVVVVVVVVVDGGEDERTVFMASFVGFFFWDSVLVSLESFINYVRKFGVSKFESQRSYLIWACSLGPLLRSGFKRRDR